MSIDKEDTHAAADPRSITIAADNKFIARMTRAIAAGKEKAVFGIKVDLTPSSARTVRGAAIFSGCGSPPALCTDVGDPGGGWNYA